MFERNYYVAINLNHNELKNAIINRLSEPPNVLNSFEGAIYYNTIDHKLYYYDGDKWIKNTEYMVKLLGTPGENIVSIYEGTNIAGDEFRFKLLKGDDYIKLTDSEEYITLNFDLDKLEESYGLRDIVKSIPFNEIPVSGTTVITRNNNRVVFPFTSVESVYDYSRKKSLNEILDTHEESISKIVELFTMSEEEFEHNKSIGLKDGIYFIYEDEQPVPPTPGSASYDPSTKLITINGTYDQGTKYITISGIYNPETKLITL